MQTRTHSHRYTLLTLTIAAHAQCQALLQTAVLAAVAVGAVNEAVPLP